MLLTGGLVTRRHKVQDAVGDLASLVWNPVRREPIVKEDGDDEHCALIADLTVWQPQYEGIFDIRVVDTDACRISPVFHRIFYKYQRWT